MSCLGVILVDDFTIESLDHIFCRPTVYYTQGLHLFLNLCMCLGLCPRVDSNFESI